MKLDFSNNDGFLERVILSGGADVEEVAALCDPEEGYDLAITVNGHDITGYIQRCGWELTKEWIRQMEGELVSSTENHRQLVKDEAKKLLEENIASGLDALLELSNRADEVADSLLVGRW